MAAKTKKTAKKPAARRIALPIGIALSAAAVIGIAAFLILRFTGRDGQPDETDGPDYSPYVDAPGLDQVTVANSDIEAAYADLAAKVRLSEAEYAGAEPGYAAGKFDRLTFSYTGAPVDTQVSSDLLSALSGQTTAVIGSDSLYPAYTDTNDPSLSTEGFEEQLIGAQAGQTLEVLVTYPKDQVSPGVDAGPILGRRVRFTVEILSLEKAKLPEMSDGLVARYTGGVFQSVEDFREDAIDRYRSQYAYLALYDAVTVKSCPQELLDAESVRYIQNTILSEYDPGELSDEQIKVLYDSLRDEAGEYARTAVTDRLKAAFLCDYAGVAFTDEEYAAALSDDFNENAAGYSYLGITDEAGMEDYFGRDNLYTAYRVNKLMNTVQRLVTFR